MRMEKKNRALQGAKKNSPCLQGIFFFFKFSEKNLPCEGDEKKKKNQPRLSGKKKKKKKKNPPWQNFLPPEI